MFMPAQSTLMCCCFSVWKTVLRAKQFIGLLLSVYACVCACVLFCARVHVRGCPQSLPRRLFKRYLHCFLHRQVKVMVAPSEYQLFCTTSKINTLYNTARGEYAGKSIRFISHLVFLSVPEAVIFLKRTKKFALKNAIIFSSLTQEKNRIIKNCTRLNGGEPPIQQQIWGKTKINLPKPG